jgi:hypothetical protein
MRTRIIFRGLTLFKFEKKKAADAGPNENLGTMTAYLISSPDPNHAGDPRHTHRPLYAALGRVLGSDEKHNGMKQNIETDLTIRDTCYRDTGVVVDGSFLDYVPSFSDLRPDVAQWDINPAYVTRRIVIPQGRVRTGEFIFWDWYGKTPARIGYMGTRYGGFATNEVIVDIGDDDDFNTDDKDLDPNCYLEITHSKDEKIQSVEKLLPLVRGKELSDDIDPNIVEIDITNLPARRRRPVFWGSHFQMIFDALGCPPLTYTGTPQYVAFDGAARAYDAYEWQHDKGMVPPTQPFPFIVDPKSDVLAGIARAPAPYVVNGVPPTPVAVRQSGEGIPVGGGGGDAPGARHMGHDPHNTEICPYLKI